jgi:hypothetical protein
LVWIRDCQNARASRVFLFGSPLRGWLERTQGAAAGKRVPGLLAEELQNRDSKTDMCGKEKAGPRARLFSFGHVRPTQSPSKRDN